MTVLKVDKLQIRIGSTLVCRDLSLELEAGQLLGVLGRNGAGKSTLLHTLIGFHPALDGNIILCNQELHSIPRHERAGKIGLLFQEADNSMPATVLETVLLGRHPYSENLLWDSDSDLALCREILGQLGLTSLQNRQVSTLSGGEKQRLSIALILAQNPQVFLLDEPSNHLDMDYQIKVLNLLMEKAQDHNAAMMMASHDINLVSRFCDQVLLLLGDGVTVAGPTMEVLTTDNLERAFGCRVQHVVVNDRDYFVPT